MSTTNVRLVAPTRPVTCEQPSVGNEMALDQKRPQATSAKGVSGMPLFTRVLGHPSREQRRVGVLAGLLLLLDGVVDRLGALALRRISGAGGGARSRGRCLLSSSSLKISSRAW
jgi:hypothetical protein